MHAFGKGRADIPKPQDQHIASVDRAHFTAVFPDPLLLMRLTALEAAKLKEQRADHMFTDRQAIGSARIRQIHRFKHRIIIVRITSRTHQLHPF